MSDPWPSQGTSPDEMNRIVQQEMDNLKALKRLSLGAQGVASQDPDLPDLEYDTVDGDALRINGDSSPLLNGKISCNNRQGGFVRQKSLNRQRSVKRQTSSSQLSRALNTHPETWNITQTADVFDSNITPDGVRPKSDSDYSPSGSVPHSDETSSRRQYCSHSYNGSSELPSRQNPQHVLSDIDNHNTQKFKESSAIADPHFKASSLGPLNLKTYTKQANNNMEENDSIAQEGVNGLENIWVPAALHPELAPNEWQAFVEEKLAEIRNSQEAQSQSRIHSRLSHVVAAPEEYVDASAILDKRRRSSSSEHRRSILELSKEFAMHDQLLFGNGNKQEESLVQEVSLKRVASSKAQPAPSSQVGFKLGATSLRRSTHRMHKPDIKPKSSSGTVDTQRAKGPSQSELSKGASQTEEERHKEREVSQPEKVVAPLTPCEDNVILAKKEPSDLSGSKSERSARPRPPLSISVQKATATTIEQPISPSTATPSPTASVMLGYRRRKVPQETTIPVQGDQINEAPVTPSAGSTGGASGTSSASQRSSSVSPITPTSIHSSSDTDSHSPPSKHSPSGSSSSPKSVNSTNSVESEKFFPSMGSDFVSDVNRELRSADIVSPSPTQKPDLKKAEEHEISKDNIKDPTKEKGSKYWKWLEYNIKSDSKEYFKEFRETTDPKEVSDVTKEKEQRSAKESKKPFANLFKKRDSRKDKETLNSTQLFGGKSHSGTPFCGTLTTGSSLSPHSSQVQSLKNKHLFDKSLEANKANNSKNSPSCKSSKSLRKNRRGHLRNDSRVNNDAFSMENAEIKLPYEIPAHQVSDRAFIMMYHRFPLHIERAIYRLSHMKLANPRRPLHEQVLLSNFMYAYLSLINYGYQQQQLAAIEEQRLRLSNDDKPFVDNTRLGNLEESQLQQLHRINSKNYKSEGIYVDGNAAESSSSSSEDEMEQGIRNEDRGELAMSIY